MDTKTTMSNVKHKELTVQIVATLTVGYNQEELDALGKTFREFKHGIEQVVKSDLLPAFQADEHSEVKVLTIGFPSKHKLKAKERNQRRLK
jgi:O-phosphoseryl-tRNA(Cys) synthetase